MSDASFGPPSQIISSIYELAPDALEQFAQWLEMRGIRIPVSQISGYQRERYVTLVEKSAVQSIPDVTETDLTFDLTDYDAQKAFNGTSTITLPYNGNYMLSGFVAWAANTTNGRYHVLKQNGVARARDWRLAAGTASTADSTISAVIVGKKGDTIKHSVYQDSGAALDVSAAASLSVALLGAY